MSSRAPVDWKDFEILGEQMKKIAKISLVAAIAVAGFTTANAQPLEEAIKNVEVTGSVVYRYNSNTNDANKGTLYKVSGTNTDGSAKSVKDISKSDDSTNNYKVALGLSSKVNDDVKFNSRFVVGAPSSTGTGDAGFASLSTNDNADQNVGTELTNANFAYTGIKSTTVSVGKQGLTTPWTVAVQSDGNEQTGTGILALSTVGPVTLAGAFFNQSNLNNSSDVKIGGADTITTHAGSKTGAVTGEYTSGATSLTSLGLIDGTENIGTVGTIAALGPVTLDAWYLDLDKKFNTYTLGAKYASKLSNIDLGADARYVSLKLDKEYNDDNTRNTIAKIAVTADAGLIDGNLAFAKTGKDGGLTALDNDASTTLLGWTLTANGKDNAKYIKAGLGIDLLSNVNLSANYGQIKWDEAEDVDGKEKEVYGQLKYTMSKNLSTYVRYGTYTKEFTLADGSDSEKVNDDVRGRIQVAYTF